MQLPERWPWLVTCQAFYSCLLKKDMRESHVGVIIGPSTTEPPSSWGIERSIVTFTRQRKKSKEPPRPLPLFIPGTFVLLEITLRSPIQLKSTLSCLPLKSVSFKRTAFATESLSANSM